MKVVSALLTAVVAMVLSARPAMADSTADERRYALIVGYNGPPAQTDEDRVRPLRYADDDALAFYQLEADLGDEAALLTVPDAETRTRYPDAARIARPPSSEEISRVITSFNARMDSDVQAGRTPSFLFYYSGHGGLDDAGRASLTLLDGPLPQNRLYGEVLDRIHAKIVHLIVDSCHAEAVVRPRDVDARTAKVSSADALAHLSQTTLARYPHVGVVIAGNGSAQTHEWELYQSGVFTHEVISALRGGADVNHDGLIEYSELAAFLAAANRAVADPRARPNSIVQPPLTAARAPLVRLGNRRAAGQLTGIPAAAGEFFVEDLHGNRLVDEHPELGFTISLWLPAGQALFLKRKDQEAEVMLSPGASIDFDSLSFRRHALTARGSLESSFRRGLFATPFGPAYYRGFVDRSDEAVPVLDETAMDSTPPQIVDGPAGPSRRRATWVLRAAAGASLASSVAFSVLAWTAYRDFRDTPLQRPAMAAGARFHTDTTVAATFLLSGLVCAVVSVVVDRR